MKTQIPSTSEVSALLEPLHHAAIQHLAKLSGVPFTTIWKIRVGTTDRAGLDTVRRFMPYIQAAAEFQSRQTAGLS
jgi:predicted transcriptional regulator